MANVALDTPISPAPAALRGAAGKVAPAQAGMRLSVGVAVRSIVGFWLFYFIINTVRMAIMDAANQLGMLERRAVVSIIGMLLTGLLCLLLRWLEGRPMREIVTVAFLASLPVSLAYAFANYAAFYLVHPMESDLQELQKMGPEKHVMWRDILDSGLNWYFFIVAWAALYIALSYAHKVRLAERTAAAYRAEAQTAQLRALRYQVNPHFLFNTLNSLSTLVMRQRGDEAERMIINLSNFFRTSLTTDPTEDVPLADEIRMQRLYLDIEQVRFPERLQVVLDVPLELENAAVPGMILQPVIENAIKYGVARSTRPVTVTIRARAGRDRLLLSVEDDGVADAGTNGQSAEKTQGHGVGLRNVCDRLAARFGADATCEYGPRRNGGFGVHLAMPLRMHSDAGR
jgi:two-component system LytT family sensor kinase